MEEAREYVRDASSRWVGSSPLVYAGGGENDQRVYFPKKEAFKVFKALSLPKRLRKIVWENVREKVPGLGWRAALDRISKALGCNDGEEDDGGHNWQLSRGGGTFSKRLAANLWMKSGEGRNLLGLFNQVMLGDDAVRDGIQGLDLERFALVVAKIVNGGDAFVDPENIPVQVEACFRSMDRRRRGRVDYEDFCSWITIGYPANKKKTSKRDHQGLSQMQDESSSLGSTAINFKMSASDARTAAAWRRYAMGSIAQRESARQGILLFLVRRAFAPEAKWFSKFRYEQLFSRLGDTEEDDLLSVKSLKEHLGALDLEFSDDDFALLLALFQVDKQMQYISKERFLAFVYNKHDDIELQLPTSNPRQRVYSSAFWSLNADYQDDACDSSSVVGRTKEDISNSEDDESDSERGKNSRRHHRSKPDLPPSPLFISMDVRNMDQQVHSSSEASDASDDSDSDETSDVDAHARGSGANSPVLSVFSGADQHAAALSVAGKEPDLTNFTFFPNVDKYLRRERIDGKTVYIDPYSRAYVLGLDMRKSKFIGKVRRVTIVQDLQDVVHQDSGTDQDSGEMVLIDYFASEQELTDDDSQVDMSSSFGSDSDESDQNLSDASLEEEKSQDSTSVQDESSVASSDDEEEDDSTVLHITGMATRDMPKKLLANTRLRYTLLGSTPIQARAWGEWERSRKAATKRGACVQVVVPSVDSAQANLSTLVKESRDRTLSQEERLNRHRPHILVELVTLPSQNRLAKLRASSKPKVLASERIMLAQVLSARERHLSDPLKTRAHSLQYKKYIIPVEIKFS